MVKLKYIANFIEEILFLFIANPFITAMVAVLLLSNTALASDKWTKEDSKYQTIYTIVTVADWLQTRDIATRNDLIETNPFLGTHPTVQEVDLKIGGAILSHYIIARMLPKRYRRKWQVFFIIVETSAVSHNINLGVNFKL